MIMKKVLRIDGVIIKFCEGFIWDNLYYSLFEKSVFDKTAEWNESKKKENKTYDKLKLKKVFKCCSWVNYK